MKRDDPLPSDSQADIDLIMKGMQSAKETLDDLNSTLIDSVGNVIDNAVGVYNDNTAGLIASAGDVLKSAGDSVSSFNSDINAHQVTQQSESVVASTYDISSLQRIGLTEEEFRAKFPELDQYGWTPKQVLWYLWRMYCLCWKYYPQFGKSDLTNQCYDWGYRARIMEDYLALPHLSPKFEGTINSIPNVVVPDDSQIVITLVG
jgi:hypothetical protein